MQRANKNHIASLVLAIAVSSLLAFLGGEIRKREWLDIALTKVSALTEVATLRAQEVQSGIKNQSKTVTTVEGALEKKQDSTNTSLDNNIRKLNDDGVTLILKKKYWQGMYLLKQAIDKEPTFFEPYLNMAIALKEVGLTRPAARYFKVAERLDDENQILLENYSIILNEGYGNEPDAETEGPPVKVKIQGEENSLGSEQILRLWGLDIQQ